MLPCLYTSEMDLPPQDVHGFKQWFAGKHSPDLYECGFITCACYRGVLGDVTIFDLYQLPSWDVLNTPPYTEQSTDDGKKYYSGVNRSGRTVVYDQARIDEYVPEKCTLRTLSWISLVRYDGPDMAQIEAALQAEQDKFKAAGVVRARYVRRGKPHPRQGEHRRPEGLCLLECESEVTAMLMNKVLLAALPSSATSVSSFVGERVVPWPDHQVNGD